MSLVEIVLVYQSLLGIYGDRGNAVVLRHRLRVRGRDAVVRVIEPGQPVPATGAVYLLGGGENAAQDSAVRHLKEDGHLFEAVARGAVLFAVCAGFQIAGRSFTTGDGDTVTEGLGLLDVETRPGPTRAVGEILSTWTKPDGTDYALTGFENHAGYTYLGASAQPLGRVEVGLGNNGDGTEGAVQGHVIGTYPHGPVLARNPDLADHLLELALGVRLEPWPDAEVEELRRQRLAWARKLAPRP